VRYLSACSGIEAATVAWAPLGWEAAAYSEIEPFPRAVLRHHYPDTPLHGDFTTIEGDEYGPIDLVVGGTPCQSFSLAGLRGGLSDERGNLALEYLRLAERTGARWLVWENVPGVFSSLSHDAPDPCPPQIDLDGDDGPEDGTEVVVEDSYDADESHAFACFLAGLSELGFGFAYRVLDAQYFGVAQRRRRVFVIGYLGDWRRAAAVLFEYDCLSGNPPPSRQTGQGIARPIASGSDSSGGYRNDADTAENLVAGTLNANGRAAGSATQQDAESGLLIALDGDDVSKCLSASNTASNTASGRYDPSGETYVAHPLRGQSQPSHRADSDTYIAHALTGEGFDASEDGTGRGTPLVAVAFALRGREDGAVPEVHDQISALRAASGGSSRDYIAFDTTQITSVANRSVPKAGDPCHPLAAGAHAPAVAFSITPSNSNKDYNARTNDHSQALTGSGNRPSARGGDLIVSAAVRRLTVVECARLQGFEGDYLTQVTWRGQCPPADGPQYKSLGNSMCTKVMRDIGRAIQIVEERFADLR
jgi:DNA (cytosine-5)-methyltransferase 1